jgi:drug/metabolite transporter superfamily protein YnfA
MSYRQRGHDYFPLLGIYLLFMFLYLSRIHTVPYFGLPLDSILDGTFFEDGSWGRLWIFYGGFFVLLVATWRLLAAKNNREVQASN